MHEDLICDHIHIHLHIILRTLYFTLLYFIPCTPTAWIQAQCEDKAFDMIHVKKARRSIDHNTLVAKKEARDNFQWVASLPTKQSTLPWHVNSFGHKVK